MRPHNDSREYGKSIPTGEALSQRGPVIGSYAAKSPHVQPPVKRKARWLLPLLISVLIILTTFIAADIYQGNSTLTVQVHGQQAMQVDLDQNVAISPYLRGSNVFPQAGTSSQDQQGNGFMSYNQQIILGLRSANIKLLRFPGGNWGEEHTPSTEQLDDFSALLNSVGAEGIMQAQLADPLDRTVVPLATRASRAALLVDYMNNNRSIQRTDARAPFHPIKYWTIGNEPDLLTNPDTQQKYTVEDYSNAFIAYSLAMHQKDPGIKIFGPEISQYHAKDGPEDVTGTLWMEGFLSKISDYERTHALPFRLLDGVSFHEYPFNDAQKDTKALLSQPAQWNTILPALHQTIRQLFAQDLPIALTEINTNPGKSVSPQDLAAAWWADTLGQLMSNHVEFCAFFSTEGVDAPYPLFMHQDLKETAMLRTMQLFAQMQSNFVPIQEKQGPVSIYTTQNQNHTAISMLLINKSEESQQIEIRSDTFLPFGFWKASKVHIDKHAMMVITLHQNANNEAFSFNNMIGAQQVPAIQHITCGDTTDSTSVC